MQGTFLHASRTLTGSSSQQPIYIFILDQRSSTFLAPETGFTEDNFSTDGVQGEGSDGSSGDASDGAMGRGR